MTGPMSSTAASRSVPAARRAPSPPAVRPGAVPVRSHAGPPGRRRCARARSWTAPSRTTHRAPGCARRQLGGRLRRCPASAPAKPRPDRGRLPPCCAHRPLRAVSESAARRRTRGRGLGRPEAHSSPVSPPRAHATKRSQVETGSREGSERVGRVSAHQTLQLLLVARDHGVRAPTVPRTRSDATAKTRIPGDRL